MATSQATAVKVARDLLELFNQQKRLLDDIDIWSRGKQNETWKPRSVTAEYDELEKRSTTPLARLVTSELAQSCYVDGFRSGKSDENSSAWRIWQANGFDARQMPLYRGAFDFGQAFVRVLPGQMPNGEKMPKARGVSARSVYAEYQDPADDEWPMWVLEAGRSRGASVLTLYDDVNGYRIGREDDGSLVFIDSFEHQMGVCPFTRFTNLIDLDGRVMGEIEPLIPILARIDQTTFDRLMVQRFASWKVRYVAGMAKPETPQEENAKKLELRQDDILIAANSQTKFGTLDASPMDPFTAARDSDLMLLSVISQLPPQVFGQVANLSADALAMAARSLSGKVHERQVTMGEAHEQWLRLGAAWLGEEVDSDAQVRWRDVESRSLAQAADALGKIATQLHFPAEILWEKIPGLTQTDIENAKRIVREGGSLEKFFAELDQMTEPVNAGNA